MSNRVAVSLVEVLVATVLLAVGVAGAVAAFVAATRVRVEASARESVAAAAERRLAWFEAQGCTVPDTVLSATAPEVEHWSLTRDSSAATLDGSARRVLGVRAIVVALRTRRECP